MFTDRVVRKQYWAITVGVPSFEEGEINIPVGEAKLFSGHRIVTRRDLVGKSAEVSETLTHSPLEILLNDGICT